MNEARWPRSRDTTEVDFAFVVGFAVQAELFCSRGFGLESSDPSLVDRPVLCASELVKKDWILGLGEGKHRWCGHQLEWVSALLFLCKLTRFLPN